MYKTLFADPEDEVDDIFLLLESAPELVEEFLGLDQSSYLALAKAAAKLSDERNFSTPVSFTSLLIPEGGVSYYKMLLYEFTFRLSDV